MTDAELLHEIRELRILVERLCNIVQARPATAANNQLFAFLACGEDALKQARDLVLKLEAQEGHAH